MDDVGEWAQLVAAIGVTIMAVGSVLTMRSHYRAIRQINEFLDHERKTLDLLDQGIKLMVAVAGVEVLRGHGGSEGEVEIQTREGFSAKVGVTEVVIDPAKKEKLH